MNIDRLSDLIHAGGAGGVSSGLDSVVSGVTSAVQAAGTDGLKDALLPIDPRELEIPARPDPSWCGSYVGNSGQVVTSEDATGMSFALGRATDEIDRNGEILMPDGDNGGSRPVAGSTYRLQEKDEDNKNPCILEGGAAVRALAAWLAKGEFRIF